jgi:hypothetical protein
VGSTVQVDVVVDGIPEQKGPSGAGPNILGFDMDLILDSSKVQVSAANMAIGMEYQGTPGGGASHSTDTTPDSDGDFFMSEIDLSATGESGKGTLARLTLQGLASGVSTLHLQYTLLGSQPHIYDHTRNINPYTVGIVVDSIIAVHPATCPTATGTPTPSPVPTVPPPLTPTPTPTPSPTPGAPTPTFTAYPTPTVPAGGPDVGLLAVDMDTTGNLSSPCAGQGCQPGMLGTVQSCAEVDPGGSTQMDIVVDSIPNHETANGIGPNIQAFDMDLILDPSVVQVSAVNNSIGMEYQATPHHGNLTNTEAPPDSDSNPGDFSMEEVDFGSVGESGKGILIRLTLQGLTPGVSSLHLQYTPLQGPPLIYDNTGGQGAYYIGEVRDARIAVHPSTCADTPAPTAQPATPTSTPTATPAAPVGGAAELHVDPKSGGSWFGGAYAVIAVVVTLLAMGVWFARRRLLR